MLTTARSDIDTIMDIQDLLEMYQFNPTNVDLLKYKDLNEKKLVAMKDHALYPLTILNYTPKTQYNKKWCRELIHAHGLVVGSSG